MCSCICCCSKRWGVRNCNLHNVICLQMLTFCNTIKSCPRSKKFWDETPLHTPLRCHFYTWQLRITVDFLSNNLTSYFESLWITLNHFESLWISLNSFEELVIWYLETVYLIKQPSKLYHFTSKIDRVKLILGKNVPGFT